MSLSNYILIFIVLLPLGTLAQEKYSSDQKKAYEEANVYFEVEDYHTAFRMYNQLYSVDPGLDEINYKIGVCCLHIRGKERKAKEYLEQAKNIEIPELHFYKGRAYHLASNFDAAIASYRYYKELRKIKFSPEEVEYYENMSIRAKKMVNDPINATIENLGDAINSPHHEYVPLITADESVLFFTSRRPGSTGGLKDPNGAYFEDVYVSKKLNGTWEPAYGLEGEVNSATHDATVGIAPSGNAVIIYRTNENLTGGDLYIANMIGVDDWQSPQKLDDNINSEYQEASACLTANENVMYFSSNRPGGYGGKDIYRVRKLPTGAWALPQNLGPNINTPYDEDAPFIHTDNKTLYFSSNGHSSMGGYDIFSAAVSENGVWSIPKNLGYPINTVEDDIYFSLSANGRYGYYSTDKPGGFGGQDIYRVELLNDDSRLTVLKGEVYDEVSGAPIKAKITLVDEDLRKTQGVYNSNSASGKYIMIIVPEKRYQVVVEAAGYHSQVDYIQFTAQECYAELSKKVTLKRKEGGEK